MSTIIDTPLETSDRLATTGHILEALSGLMDIDSYAWNERGALTLHGQLAGPAQSLHRAIRIRMEALGFTPFLSRNGDRDELLALPGVIEHHAPRVWLPVLLFLLAIWSVMTTGAMNELHVAVSSSWDLTLLMFATMVTPSVLVKGIPFAAALLGILFTHEMGHYIVGKLRHAPVSLPYFIPIPPIISFTGTMGAVIVQREPMEDRRTVLEIGIAGPLAGLVVAIPLLFYGLMTSRIGPAPVGGYIQEGNSLLYLAAKYLVFGRYLPSDGVDVQLSPVAWGAWIGLLVTMLNLLPVGQLDGGHIAYALLGKRAEQLSYVMIAICVALALLIPNNWNWLVWAALIFLIGPRHPAPLNDITPIGRKHQALAIFGLIIFALLFMPSPLAQVGG